MPGMYFDAAAEQLVCCWSGAIVRALSYYHRCRYCYCCYCCCPQSLLLATANRCRHVAAVPVGVVGGHCGILTAAGDPPVFDAILVWCGSHVPQDLLLRLHQGFVVFKQDSPYRECDANDT